MTIVFDTNCVVSAIFWPHSTARRTLGGLARRQYQLAVTREVFAEYEAVAAEFIARFPERNPRGLLDWLHSKARWVDGAPLGKQRSRDLKDDPFLSCALAARAKFLVTGDRDLLALVKSFGIQMVTPAQFLGIVRTSIRRPGAQN
jgi:putative PIN family toxin of toxin-antitoxin system